MQTRIAQLAAKITSHATLQAWLINYIGPVESSLALQQRLNELLASLELIHTFQSPLLDRLEAAQTNNLIHNRLVNEFARLSEQDITIEDLQKKLAILLRVQGADDAYQQALARLFPDANSMEEVQETLDGLLGVMDVMETIQKELDYTLEPDAVIQRQMSQLVNAANDFQNYLFAKLHSQNDLPESAEQIQAQLLKACHLQLRSEADLHLFIKLCAPLYRFFSDEQDKDEETQSLRTLFHEIENQFKRLMHQSAEKLKYRGILARNLAAYAEETLLTEKEDELGEVLVQTTYKLYHCKDIAHAKSHLAEPLADLFEEETQVSIRDLRKGDVATTIKAKRDAETIRLEKKYEEEKVERVRKKCQDEIQDINHQGIHRDIISNIAEVANSGLSLPQLTQYFVVRAELADIMDSLIYQEKMQLQLWCSLSPKQIDGVPEILDHIRLHDLFLTNALKTVLSSLRHYTLSLKEGVTMLDDKDYEAIMDSIKECRLAMQRFLSRFNNRRDQAYYHHFKSAQRVMNDFYSGLESRLQKLVASPDNDLTRHASYQYTENRLKECRPKFVTEKQLVYRMPVVAKEKNDSREKESEEVMSAYSESSHEKKVERVREEKPRAQPETRHQITQSAQASSTNTPVTSQSSSAWWGFFQPMIDYFKSWWPEKNQPQEAKKGHYFTTAGLSVSLAAQSPQTKKKENDQQGKGSSPVFGEASPGKPIVPPAPAQGQTGLLPRLGLLSASPSSAPRFLAPVPASPATTVPGVLGKRN